MDETLTYTAIYEFVPNEAEQESCIVIRPGDVLEVKLSDIKGDRNALPAEWIYGDNKTTNAVGYFLGNYVQYDPVPAPAMLRPKPPKPKPRGLTNTSSQPNDSGYGSPHVSGKGHKWGQAYFVKPVLCLYCEDYIWGVTTMGYQCAACHCCVHDNCEPYINHLQCSEIPINTETYEEAIALENWTTINVAEWMATVNLSRYVEIFRKNKVSGVDMIEISEGKLLSMGIKDQLHQLMILICTDELKGRHPEQQSYASRLPPIEPVPHKDVPVGQAVDNGHCFKEYTFSDVQRCHLCGNCLLGIFRQGLQCSNCGLCCHQQCSKIHTCSCDMELVGHRRRQSFITGSLFNVALEESFNDGSTTPFPLLNKCMLELEIRGSQTKEDLFRAYRSSGKNLTAVVDALSCNDIQSVDLSPYALPLIAGLIKKYLRELPEPVIPTAFYKQFIDASKGDESRRSPLFAQYITQLPTAHQSAIRLIMSHIMRLLRHQQSCSHGCEISTLSQVFYHFFMRPPWKDIIDIVYNTEAHIRIFEEIFTSDLWQKIDIGCSITAPPPVVPPRPASRFSTGMSVDSGKTMPASVTPASLQEADWYWGDISREEVNEKLRDTEDGTFLVRNAASSSSHYTLTLRKGGSNKLIKIFFKDGRYGFVEPLQFVSVMELIDYYTHNSLSHYNKTLDTKLEHSVRKERNQPIHENKEQLKKLLLTQHKEYLQKAEEYDEKYEKHDKLQQEVRLKSQAVEAYKETILIFNDQLCVNAEFIAKAPSFEVNKVNENRKLLQQRLNEIAESQKCLEENLKSQMEESQTLMAQMNQLRPELRRFYQQQEETKGWLQGMKFTQRYIEEFLEQSMREAKQSESEQSNNRGAEIYNMYDHNRAQLAHEDESMWFVNCGRNDAALLLKDKPIGTFLIRPRNQTDSYALSIVTDKMIGHCIIERTPTGFGFAEPYFIHETLTDLVLHYSEVSLAEHNDDLDLKLSYPVNAHAQQHENQYMSHNAQSSAANTETEAQTYVEYNYMGNRT